MAYCILSHVHSLASKWKALTLCHNNGIPHLLEIIQASQTCFTYETIDICNLHLYYSH